MKSMQTNLKENLIFVGTIYDSFEALEETMGKLKLERPLFLVYLAKKAFAEEVFKTADEKFPDENTALFSSEIQLQNSDYQRVH